MQNTLIPAASKVLAHHSSINTSTSSPKFSPNSEMDKTQGTIHTEAKIPFQLWTCEIKLSYVLPQYSSGAGIRQTDILFQKGKTEKKKKVPNLKGKFHWISRLENNPLRSNTLPSRPSGAADVSPTAWGRGPQGSAGLGSCPVCLSCWNWAMALRSSQLWVVFTLEE